MSVKEKKQIQINIDKALAEGGMPFDLKLTEEQRANQDLLNSIKGLPEEKLDTRKKIENWLKDESEDY
ncbi:hypothetical protein [Pediococcus ethanolidurans]|uniref:hypothetical protein n=1 Tax=Pediococcus ethanolidurans TaxID=319653 RepID=UPI001C1F0891|nr:hypothetical protein [Pediococcus ethanolidurans]MBU7554242.1 hypothetical protein [Pediococcus ethanolidurans]MBU7564112.1 hypothetical protein [Pediococcus ethanolidurans]MCV3316020.1 hypothetical protein [Pediococcus ethanolidurans]MCV3327417.1 hypothetical protein [Pediococcus ethanolidurans]